MIDSFVVGAGLFVFMIIVIMFMSSSMTSSGPSGAMMLFMLVPYLAVLLAPIVYNAVFVVKYGATPGKMAMGIKVVRPDGHTVSTGQAWGRAFADILTQMTMCIGYLLAAFDSEKRALHDHVCSTRVIGNR